MVVEAFRELRDKKGRADARHAEEIREPRAGNGALRDRLDRVEALLSALAPDAQREGTE